jgi:hypothetical protein
MVWGKGSEIYQFFLDEWPHYDHSGDMVPRATQKNELLCGQKTQTHSHIGQSFQTIVD